MFRFTLIAVITLLAAVFVIVSVVAIVSDGPVAIIAAAVLFFPFAVAAFFALVLAMVIEGHSLSIAWRGAGSWLVLTVVVGYVWLLSIVSPTVEGGTPWSTSDSIFYSVIDIVYGVSAAIVIAKLRHRFRVSLQRERPGTSLTD